MGIRYGNWKNVFKTREHTGIDVRSRGFTDLRVPQLRDLRAVPYERGDESILCDKWMIDRAFLQAPTRALAAEWLPSFGEFPPRWKPASADLDRVMERMTEIPGKRRERRRAEDRRPRHALRHRRPLPG